MEERCFQRRVAMEEMSGFSPVAPLGLKADACRLENAALRGPLFNDTGDHPRLTRSRVPRSGVRGSVSA